MVKVMDPVERLFQKRFSSSSESNQKEPYVFLLQHSRNFQLRLLASNETLKESEQQIYKRAGLRTPSENSRRDLKAGDVWMRHICSILPQWQEQSALVWIQTTSQRPPVWLSDTFQIIHAASDPFGWENSGQCHLDHLDPWINTIMDRTVGKPSVVILESLSHVILRHGILKVIHFLSQLANMPTVRTLVVRVEAETLTPQQHQRLEDMSHAVLSLQGGEAILLRQGVRERGNLVRENILYDIVTQSDGTDTLQWIVPESTKAEKDPLESSVTVDRNITNIERQDKTTATSTKRGKVQLRLQDDSETRGPSAAPNNTSPQPNIIVEDDDPEFDDYDEEDPDDDLDI